MPWTRIHPVAYDYKVPLRDQLFLLPPSIADWLPEKHLVWFVLDVVAVVDLSAFHARHPNDGAGRAAYDPEMMLALLLYGYCRGLRSSRRIEAACRADLAFRAICADVFPDHIAIARFRSHHEEALRAVFIDVLALCAKAGLASLGTIAIDGTKIAADAALGANRSEATIAAEVDAILAQAGRADDAEASQPSLGSELPAELARPGSRLARLRAALGEIEAEGRAGTEADQARSARLAEDAAKGRRPRGTAPKDRPWRGSGRRRTWLRSRSAGTMRRPRSPSWRQFRCWQGHRAQALLGEGGGRSAGSPRGPGQHHRSAEQDHEDGERVGTGLQRPGGGERPAGRRGLRPHPGPQRRRPARADDGRGRRQRHRGGHRRRHRDRPR